MRTRVAHAAADGMALGAGIAALLNLVAWGIHGLGGTFSFNETLGFDLAAWLVRSVYFGAKRFTLAIALAAATLALLSLWRRTRAPTRIVASLLAGGAGAWFAALVVAFAFVFAPTAAVVLPLVSIGPAWALARNPHRSVTALVIVALGVGVGLLCAQLTSLPWESIRPPLYGFLPPVLAACAVASMAARRSADRVAFGRRLARIWGIGAACLSATYLVALEAYHLRARPLQGPATRVVEDWAYDVFVTGEPASLMWTTRQRAYVLNDAYGDQGERDTLDESVRMVERIWRSPHGDFYLQASRQIGWWRPVTGARIPRVPDAWLSEEGWFPDPRSVSTVSTFAEDPHSRRFVVFTEWLSQYALVEHDGARAVASGKLSNAVWPWWYVTIDPAARLAFASSAFDDGGLYAFDVDSMVLRRQADRLYLYETVLDPTIDLLWGVRPLSGEVLAVDRQTLEVRQRIRVEVGVRDLQFDPDSGDLFTASFLSGVIYRIDHRSRTPSPIAWCGRLTRNLYLDAARRTLWAATADGVCRVSVGP